MAIKIFIVLLFVSFNGYAQTKQVRIVLDSGTYVKDPMADTVDVYSKLYTIVVNWDDSAKYYYHRYLFLQHKGVPDSINHWYWMLKKLKK